jgi:Ni/Co efflux regulator RcnB
MKKLAIIILAGTAMSGPAVAQTVAPPVPWQDVPAMRLNAPARMAAPAPGVTWQQRGPAVQPVRAATPAPAMRPMPQRPTMTPAPSMRPAHGSRPPVTRPPMQRPDRPVVRPNHNQHNNYVHRGDNRPVGRGPHHGPRFPHIKPIKHGHVVPRFWFGPRFHIVNWGMYGFSQPFGDQRWIRYYDDAYLIDRGGRVHDSRYGMEWDRYGDAWAYDQNGIPMRGDDGGYGHGYQAEEDYSYGGGYQQQHHAPPPVAAPGCAGPGYPQPGGYMPAPCGYGAAPAYYGYGYAPMVITETTTVTTTAPTVTEHIYYEESAPPVRRRAARHRPVAPDCNCGPAPAPTPPPIPYGEKG